MSIPAAERGSLTVTDRALTHLSEHAAREAMTTWGGPGRRARVRLRRARGDVRTRIEVPYPYPADTAATELSAHLARRLDTLADMQVRHIKVAVSYTAPAGTAAAAENANTAADTEPLLAPAPAAVGPLPRAHRVPAAFAVLIAGIAAALALTAVIQQRYRRTGSVDAWAKTIADARPADAAVTVCAVALVLLGLFFLICALAPARRRMAMAMATDSDTSERRIHATVSNRAAAAYLRHAVREIDALAVVKVRRAGTARVWVSVPESETNAARERLHQIAAQAPEALAAQGLRVRTAVGERKDPLR